MMAEPNRALRKASVSDAIARSKSERRLNELMIATKSTGRSGEL
jgi:hypothetical protein